MVLNRIKHSQVRATSRSIKQCNTPAQNTSVVSELGTSNTGITPNAQINSGGHSGEFNPVAPPRVKRCFLCNSPNHIQSFCPQRSNQGYHASAASSIFIMDPTSMLAEKQSTLTWKKRTSSKQDKFWQRCGTPHWSTATRLQQDILHLRRAKLS